MNEMTQEESKLLKDMILALSKDSKSLLRVHQLITKSTVVSFLEIYQEVLKQVNEEKKNIEVLKRGVK